MRGVFASCAIAALLLALTLAFPDPTDNGHSRDTILMRSRRHGHGHSHDNGHGHSHDNGHGHSHGGGQGQDHDSTHRYHHPPGEDYDHSGDKTSQILFKPNTEFAAQFYKNLKAHTTAGENIMFSPCTIALSLSMLLAGAEHDTYNQMRDVLHYNIPSLNKTKINYAYEHITHMLFYHQDQIALISALALGSGFELEKAYNDIIKHYYHGNTVKVDFAEQAEAVKQINTFIAQETKNKITDLLKEVDAETVMMLLSSMYYSGTWANSFDPSKTTKADFHVSETKKVTVDMMQKNENLGFYEDNENHVTVVKTHFTGNNSMIIVLPDEGKMEEVEAKLDFALIDHWRTSVSPKSVDLYLPRFSISADGKVGELLKEMGMTNVFEDTAEFITISKNKNLKLTQMFHKDVLTIKEDGSGTATEVGDSLAVPVTLNRPFLFFILQQDIKSFLFMGKLSDPTAN
ncbi:alpha-1-antitrypsin homolog [Lampris incognitus]|uniref:alpha-1-antitrypsin homolog n=1 Tax=Lampris incognitus TaxID=2546036 RepID=UPI0024B61A46|nr:alpha-1-antitrypsin homolog [Lampris incognitus]